MRGTSNFQIRDSKGKSIGYVVAEYDEFSIDPMDDVNSVRLRLEDEVQSSWKAFQSSKFNGYDKQSLHHWMKWHAQKVASDCTIKVITVRPIHPR